MSTITTIKQNTHSGNGPVSVTLGTGALAMTFPVITVAEDNLSTDGGDCAEPRVVPEYTSPIEYTHKHKMTVLLITIDSAALRPYLKQRKYWDVNDDNAFLPLVIRERNAARQYRNVTYKTDNTLLVKMRSVLQQLAKEQITELTVDTYGDDETIYGVWSN